MSKSLQRLLILILCAWLPLPGVAAALLNCHLDTPAPAEVVTQQLVGDHSGCGSQTPLEPKTTDKSVQKPSCDHCRADCQTGQYLLLSSAPVKPLLIPQELMAFVSAIPPLPLPDLPQRPPQTL